MSDQYILTEDHRVVPERDLFTWARWMEKAERRVGYDMIGPFRVSTVFLGLDHDFVPSNHAREPLIFETMIFDHSREEHAFGRSYHAAFDFQRRYRTWDAAKSGHDYAVKLAKRMLRWTEFREARKKREVGELKNLLEKS